MLMSKVSACPFCNTNNNHLKMYSRTIDEFIHLECLKEYFTVARYETKLSIPEKILKTGEEMIAYLDEQEKEVLKWHQEDKKQLEIL